MNDLHVDYRSLAALKPHARTPRTHSKRQIRQIADSIKAFGFTNPILVDDAGGVLAGHGRIEAAKLLGIPVVPTIRLASMTEAQKRAYVIAVSPGAGCSTLELSASGPIALIRRGIPSRRKRTRKGADIKMARVAVLAVSLSSMSFQAAVGICFAAHLIADLPMGTHFGLVVDARPIELRNRRCSRRHRPAPKENDFADIQIVNPRREMI